ncbi:hypothetical protein LVJ83_05875 [Uruburuella testudinis]|uniref:Lipoprotein n=1 Tax=Uruburuella testudinis TaxID=1282863 RepID=A0ABY4DVC3_9NEIS|nr:hypothetical protein [Uruburuella testudinis]UOO82984.1 hypothetical protein LVJ83_05875 [Uruburuella testudinis]
MKMMKSISWAAILLLGGCVYAEMPYGCVAAVDLPQLLAAASAPTALITCSIYCAGQIVPCWLHTETTAANKQAV